MTPCPYTPGATVSSCKTVNGLRVVLDCTLFGDDWHEGMLEGLHECGSGRLGPPCLEPKPNNFNLVLYHKSDLRLDWDRMDFLPEHLPPRKGPSRGVKIGACCVYSPDWFWEDIERCQKEFDRTFGRNAFHGPTDFSICGGSPFCLDTMRHFWWANFPLVLGAHSCCNHRVTGRSGGMPSRGEGMCRECRVGDGYLVVSPLEMDVFMDLGHLERAIMKFLCPPHPQAAALASDGHPEIY